MPNRGGKVTYSNWPSTLHVSFSGGQLQRATLTLEKPADMVLHTTECTNCSRLQYLIPAHPGLFKIEYGNGKQASVPLSFMSSVNIVDVSRKQPNQSLMPRVS